MGNVEDKILLIKPKTILIVHTLTQLSGISNNVLEQFLSEQVQLEFLASHNT